MPASLLRLVGRVRPLQGASSPTLVGGAVVVPCRTVTDIEHYREVDQSHLHIKEAESFKRKFLLKLARREKENNRRAQRAGKTTTTAQDEDVKNETWEEVEVGNYIERGPADMLKLFSSHLSPDYTAADQRFHDDPYLTPYFQRQKKDYLMAKAGGRNAARFILNRHPHLFTENRIEMEPPIKKFMPTARVDAENPTEELLNVFIEGSNVSEAIHVFDLLSEKGVALEAETKQALLELIAFHQDGEGLEEDAYLQMGVTQGKKYSRDAPNTWDNENKAQEVYVSIDPSTPDARQAMLLGYAKHGLIDKAREMLGEMEKSGDELTLDGFNAKIKIMDEGDGAGNALRQNIVNVLTEMNGKGVKPDVVTLTSCLDKLRRRSRGSNLVPSVKLALDLIAEFKRIGISPSIFNYAQVFYLGPNTPRPLSNQILDELSGKEWAPIRQVDDLQAPYHFMRKCEAFNDLGLCYRLHNDVTLHGGNSALLSSFDSNFYYYKSFMETVLKHEPVDVSMEWYNKLTPHVFSPFISLYKDLLSKICQEKAFRHLPKLWADMRLTSFSGVGKAMRLETSLAFLRKCHEAQLSPADEETLKRDFLVVAKEALEDTMNEPDGRMLRLSMNTFAAGICDVVIQMCIEQGGSALGLAARAFNFCAENVVDMPGSLEETTVSAYVDALLASGDGRTAVKCVLYAAELRMDNAPALAAAVSGAKNIVLDESEKKHFNRLFSHDAKWQVLN